MADGYPDPDMADFTDYDDAWLYVEDEFALAVSPCLVSVPCMYAYDRAGRVNRWPKLPLMPSETPIKKSAQS